jgi:5-methylthioadenosine/S-adenosylhomocysteine deaminase
MHNIARNICCAIYIGFLCTFGIAQQQQRTLVLHGSVVTPDEVITDGFVAVQGEKITGVGIFSSRPLGTVVETNSVIYPGLIDLHNHITWNLFPRWRQNVEFSNRYDWQQRTAYSIALSTPHAQLFREGLACATNRYGEVKAIVGGATSTVGTLNDACIVGLARNLDFYSGFYGKEINQEKLRYEVFPMQVASDQASQIRNDLQSGKLTSYIVHLSEGKPTDASAAREFNMFQAQGFLRPGVSVIHAGALGRAQFKQLATNGVGLIWSPRSNIELYGATTDVSSAKQEGVKIAIAPDWSPSGSDGLLQELKYVATWNMGQNPPVFSDDELVKIATLYPAQLARVDDKIGSIKQGLYADLLLIRKSEQNAYQNLFHANPADVRLVMVNGVAIYGDSDLMHEIRGAYQLQALTVCDTKKLLLFDSVAGLPASWNELTQLLNAKLNRWGSSLAPLTQCNSTNQN